MAAKEKVMLEKVVQQKAKEYAYDRYGEYHPKSNPTGLLKVIKLTMLAMYGEAGWPDHFWMVHAQPKPRVFFVEVKKMNGVCSDLQIDRHEMLRGMGFDVYVAEGLTRYKQILDVAVAKLTGKTVRLSRQIP